MELWFAVNTEWKYVLKQAPRCCASHWKILRGRWIYSNSFVTTSRLRITHSKVEYAFEFWKIRRTGGERQDSRLLLEGTHHDSAANTEKCACCLLMHCRDTVHRLLGLLLFSSAFCASDFFPSSSSATVVRSFLHNRCRRRDGLSERAVRLSREESNLQLHMLLSLRKKENMLICMYAMWGSLEKWKSELWKSRKNLPLEAAFHCEDDSMWGYPENPINCVSVVYET